MLFGMGIFVGVRGWIEIDHHLMPTVAELLAAYARVSPSYAKGWATPASMWHAYVMYGADVRDIEIEGLRHVVEQIAAVPAFDEDNDRPIGFFLLDNERGPEHSAQWFVRDGAVITTGIGDEHPLRWLNNRP
jgi:hypothetical protein